MTKIVDGLMSCDKCPRCGQAHQDLVVAPIEGETIEAKCLHCPGMHPYKFFSACPETGGPILLFMTREVGCRKTVEANQKGSDGNRPQDSGGR